MSQPRQHNYLVKLEELYRQGLIPVPSVCWVDIYHDDWCGIYRGDYCNCDPDVQVHQLPHRDPGRN
jgi:hypothetical protein